MVAITHGCMSAQIVFNNQTIQHFIRHQKKCKSVQSNIKCIILCCRTNAISASVNQLDSHVIFIQQLSSNKVRYIQVVYEAPAVRYDQRK